MKIRDIVMIGILSAILLVAQVGLAFIPNVELVSLLIILYTKIYKSKALYIIYVFVMLEGIIYGFGLWWINYTYVWTVLFIIVLLFRKEEATLFWTIICGFYGLLFGALCSIPYFFMGGIPSAFAYFVSGIPFDIMHGIGNCAVAIVLYRPLYHVLKKLSLLNVKVEQIHSQQ